MRPHPFFPTLEFRICDIPTRVDDTIAIAALFQAIVAKLTKLIEKNLGFRLYRRMLIQENKWRAVRWGIDGKMIDFGKQKEVPARDLILELLDFVDDVVDELGSRKEIEHIHTILERGTSAEEQLRGLSADQRSQSRGRQIDRADDGKRSAHQTDRSDGPQTDDDDVNDLEITQRRSRSATRLETQTNSLLYDPQVAFAPLFPLRQVVLPQHSCGH